LSLTQFHSSARNPSSSETMKHYLSCGVAGLLLQATSSLSTPLTNHRTHCSNHAIFTLHNITYSDNVVYSTPAHLATAGAYIHFNLTNTAVTYTTECSAYVSNWGWPEFFSGDQIYVCKAPGSVDQGARTNFTFSTGSGKIDLNSTWSCGSRDER
jgi:Alternaria alternata allergen 1